MTGARTLPLGKGKINFKGSGQQCPRTVTCIYVVSRKFLCLAIIARMNFFSGDLLVDLHEH